MLLVLMATLCLAWGRRRGTSSLQEFGFLSPVTVLSCPVLCQRLLCSRNWWKGMSVCLSLLGCSCYSPGLVC